MRTYNMIHETDAEYVAELAASMAEHGWIGGPVVVDGDWLVTGHHRQDAAVATGTEMQTVEIADLFEAAGLDYEEVMAEYDYPSIGEPCYVDVLDALPLAVRQDYDLDLH